MCEEKNLLIWCLYTYSQHLIILGLHHSNISIGNITKFSTISHTVRMIFDQVRNYYHWLQISAKFVKGEKLVHMLLDEINQTFFINGLRNQVRIQKKSTI